MLNTCLTVRAGEAGSHSKRGWERFTESVIDVVDQYGGANLPSGPTGSETAGVGRGIVFLAWGAWASERVSKLSKVCISSFLAKSAVDTRLTMILTVQTPHTYERCASFSIHLLHEGALY